MKYISPLALERFRKASFVERFEVSASASPLGAYILPSMVFALLRTHIVAIAPFARHRKPPVHRLGCDPRAARPSNDCCTDPCATMWRQRGP